jgi:hypothetical protein
MARRTAKELWDALDQATLDAELESELAMTPEERRQDLVKAGYDVDALDAEADAFFASLPAMVAPTAAPAASPPAAPDAPQAPVQPLAPVVPIRARKAWTTWVLAAAALAVVGIGIKAAIPPPPVFSPPPPKEEAAWLRNEAQLDCDAERWKPCQRRLDDAAQVDPSGEGEARVVKMRAAIAAGLAAAPGDAGRAP